MIFVVDDLCNIFVNAPLSRRVCKYVYKMPPKELVYFALKVINLTLQRYIMNLHKFVI